jgi:PKD repeat protein
MAVVANFTSNKTTGLIPPAESVQFTDLSTGNPDSWLWDFGDGQFSNVQNPLHTYMGGASETFTVKLTAWIASSSTPISIPNGHFGRITGFETDDDVAWATYTALDWTPAGSAGIIFQNLGNNLGFVLYRAHQIKGTITMPALTALTAAFIAEAQRTDPDPTWPQGTQAGEAEFLINGAQAFTISGIGAMSTWEAVGDLTSYAGQIFPYIQQPVEVQLPDAIVDDVQGFATINVRITQYFVSSADNMDLESKSDYIVFGSPPVASFGVSPSAGSNPLTVNLINTSTEAIGLPTTWSWKKRISGSGDAFVEFSTDKNPTIILGK